MSLRDRELVGELMDDPHLDPREHELALCGLARLNRLSNASGPVIRAVDAHVQSGAVGVLDVASGSGDGLVAVLRSLGRRGIGVHGSACDISPFACERVRRRCDARGHGVRVFEADALEAGGLGVETYDVVMNALFLHHLGAEDAARALRSMAAALKPGGLLVVSDLVRSRLNYGAALVASRLVTRSRVVHTDALLSVRAAFTIDEAGALAGQAGLAGAVVRGVWPERFLLTWAKA